MVAAVSLAGIFLDVLGGLYLAYDLLGGQHGPLRLLTRIVTYSIVFGIGYGIGLGLFFGVACGLATGITVSIELQRTARRQDHYPLQWEAVFSAIRGLGFRGSDVSDIGPAVRGFIFGADHHGTDGRLFPRDAPEYGLCSLSRRPRLTRRHAWGVIARTIGYTSGGAALQCAGEARRAPMGIRAARRTGDGPGDWSGHHIQPLHRVLCR